MGAMLILTTSIALQFVAAFLALRLIRITGRRTGWAMIAAAVSLMALRRCITLFGFLFGNRVPAPDPLTEWVALTISVLMAVGIAAINPLFLSIKRSEEALRRSHHKYETLVDSINGIIWEADARTFRFSFVSKQAERLLGYPAERWISEPTFCKDHIHPDDRQTVLDFCARVAESAGDKQTHDLEYRMIAADGRAIWLRNIATVLAKDDQPDLLQGVMIDITERKRAEETLQRFQFCMEHAPEGVFFMNRDAGFSYVNEQACRSLGYTRDELMCLKLWDIDPIYSKESWETKWTQRQEDQIGTMHVETLHRRKDGVVFPVEIWAKHLWLGASDFHVAFVRDITERKQAEEALKEAEARLRLALQAGRIGMWDWNMVTGQIAWSIEHEKLWGMAPGTFKGTYEEFDARLHPEDRNGLSRAVTQAIAERRNYCHEYRVVWPDGSVHWIAGQGKPLFNDADNPVRMIGVVRDITEQRLAEAEINRLNQDLERRVTERTAQLEAVNKEIEAFSYSVSHDLRAPLRAMGGFSRVLLAQYADRLDSQGKDFLHRVDEASRRMAELIEDLLNLSRITRRDMRKKPLDLTALAHSIAEEIQGAEPKRRVTFLIQDRLKAEGDPGLMRIALENLFGNAWKFTSKRSDATIEFGRFEQEGRPVYFVRDNGAGFNMDYADKLFGAFQRLHSINEFEGTGIGLATVQRIIHRHGGKIWAEAEVEKGATFYFTI